MREITEGGRLQAQGGTTGGKNKRELQGGDTGEKLQGGTTGGGLEGGNTMGWFRWGMGDWGITGGFRREKKRKYKGQFPPW